MRGIDLEQARAEYAKTVDPGKKAVYEAHSGRSEAPGASAATAEAGPAAKTARRRSAVEVADPETGDILDFSQARTRKEMANARRAELDYKSKSGLLISREEVAAKEFAIARKVRDRIMGFPARVANLVPPDAMKELVDECDALCRELQDDAAAIAETTTTS